MAECRVGERPVRLARGQRARVALGSSNAALLLLLLIGVGCQSPLGWEIPNSRGGVATTPPAKPGIASTAHTADTSESPIQQALYQAPDPTGTSTGYGNSGRLPDMPTPSGARPIEVAPLLLREPLP